MPLSSAHMGAVITSLSPLFQSLFALLLLKARISARQLTAFGLSFAGVLIVTGLPGSHGDTAFGAGSLFLLAAALFWSYYSVLAKKIADYHPVLRITTWGILIATLFALPAAWYELPYWQWSVLKNPAVLASIIYLSVFSTAVALYCWNKGLALTSPHQAGIFFFLQPVVGSIAGVVILDEVVSLPFFAGGILILTGVYIAMRSTG